ncbi:MAG: LacI family DNA-binding transcriptional regulator [Lachnospiraceae bacterium]|nr:LacI family DNA-binding transcriptional regulator [Lachnospiraceae bacterium]
MATLKDVARAAGVAPITVSRVINNQDTVKEKTRDKVLKVMAEMQYIPNVAARNLITKRSHVIDVYIPEDIELDNPFMLQLIAGISEVLSEKMYSFLILRNRKQEHICDGYIVTGLLTHEIEEFYQYAKERNRPVALFGHTTLHDVDCIDVDNVAGARMAVEYLIENGHTEIAMINVAEDKDYTVDRFEGYRQALQKHGCPFDEKKIVYSPNQVKDSVEAAKELLKRGGFSAIFCATDTIAIGVENAISEAGLRIPEDISVIGYDGLGHQLLATPKVASIQQPVFQIGKMLARTLVDRLDNKPTRVEKTVDPILLTGDSVKNVCN